ncbi:hypothetical protein K443DRAFT_13423 [Laccaria amethystina LaAM-08-1]|uniref:Uncharacterized protein n=1 Tax=Laccaria amethystina LaAM-08-1 TaxID=1095629 RepID=A0A0C9WVF2_9AGAR|nr:hypothetical protein K443DRAFT_13423 [Laccaria amethystina LaAM-08-1]
MSPPMKVFAVLCFSLSLVAHARIIDDHDSAMIYSGSFGWKRSPDAPVPTPIPSISVSEPNVPIPIGWNTTSVNYTAPSFPQSAPNSKKTPTGAIIGGVMGGIVLLILAGVLSLVFLRRRRRRQARVEPPLPDTRAPETDVDWATMPHAKPPAVLAPPPPGIYPGQHPYMPPPVSEASRVGLPQASIITQPAVVRPSITSSSTDSATPAATSIMGASASGSLPSETQPIRAATSQEHNFEDSSSVTSIISPNNSTNGSVTPSIASSAPLVPRSTRCLTDEEVDFVASLYRQRLPPPDVARIIDNMLNEDGLTNGILATESKLIQPPANDFKGSGRG